MKREECPLSTTKPKDSDFLLIIMSQSGSPMVVVIVILAVIAIGATFAARNSTRDLTVAGMDSLHKLTLNETDGATELVSELLEQNISCPDGFTTALRGSGSTGYVEIMVDNLKFWQNNRDKAVTPDLDRGVADFYFPADYDSDSDNIKPNTAIALGGYTRFAHGGAIQMSAGYEGKGKGAAGGGGLMIFDFSVVRKSLKESEAICRMEWMHVIGQEGKCTP